MAERRFQGRSASNGLVMGPLRRVDKADLAERQTATTPEEERKSLREAMGKARADLATLAGVASGDGADILAFQQELLSDPALVEDVLIKIDGGQSAFAAWMTGLEGQIGLYEAADDEYFRARASDLADLRERVAKHILGITEVPPALADHCILLAEDFAPSQFLALDHEKLGGVALFQGSPNSHVSMLARARGVPMIVSLHQSAKEIKPDTVDVIMDADQALLIEKPLPATTEAYLGKVTEAAKLAQESMLAKKKPAVTQDGEAVDVFINIDDPDVIDDETLGASDGVGLMRTEFLFIGCSILPDENQQYLAYSRLLDRLTGKPAIIRTLDIGGDKPLPGFQQTAETNPFLGLRGIRFCLQHEAHFRVQARALLRAAHGRPLKVMLPMVCVQAEIDRSMEIFESCLLELKAEGVAAAMPPIGIMIETPAAAIAIDCLEAAFYSIGTNDLTQYVMAAARDASGSVADLLDPSHPAVQRLIQQVVVHGKACGREVSLCGDMASNPALLPGLLGAGLRKLSVAPAAMGRIKADICKINLSTAINT